MNEDLATDSNPMNVSVEDCSSGSSLRLAEMRMARGNITPEIVELIEDDLEFYEMVALVFLLYDSVPLALQRLIVAEKPARTGNSHRLLSDWARCEQSHSNWESKFLEALCIIQNYYVVKKLGYHKEDVVSRYLPNTPDVSCQVNLMRKALYTLCEKLTEAEAKELVRKVHGDFTTPPSVVTTNFLEIHFLYWIDANYVDLRNDLQSNVADIKKHLKVMEKYALADSLESIAKQYDRIRVPDEIEMSENNSSLSGQPRCDQSSTNDTGSVQSDWVGEEEESISGDEFYKMDPRNMGYCIIINQKNFDQEPNPELMEYVTPDLECRVGTDIDRDRLSEAFGNFGFTVKIWENLDHIQLLDCVAEVARDLVQEKHSCFVLCILSHGKQDQIYGVNSIPVSIEEIKENFNGKLCPKLINKPKIFIIQACQGTNLSEAVPDPHSDLANDGPNARKVCSPLADTLTCMSTIPGYKSFRHKINGSWFIQALCDMLLKPTTDVCFLDILTAVNGRLKKKHAVGKTMQPEFTSRLTKKLCFPVNITARKKVAELIFMRKLFNDLVDEYLIREFRRGQQ